MQRWGRNVIPCGFGHQLEAFHELLALLVIASAQDYDELVASDPENGTVLEYFADHAAGALQHLVAVAVTSGIVHVLEVVDIAHYNAERTYRIA